MTQWVNSVNPDPTKWYSLPGAPEHVVNELAEYQKALAYPDMQQFQGKIDESQVELTQDAKE